MTTLDNPSSRTLIWMFLTFTVFYAGITRGHFLSSDEIALYQTTRSLWEEGSLETLPIQASVQGPDGRYYGAANPGQSIASMPLYGLGKMVRKTLTRIGRQDWVQTLAGPSIQMNESYRWSGDVEIFFVNLFNCLTTAALCAVFFAFSVQLGASPRWALVSTALLGLTSLPGSFSTGFFQHSSEALLLLCAFYLLFLNAQRPGPGLRLWAGLAVAAMVLVRSPSLVALPGLGLFCLWSIWQRGPAGERIARFRTTGLRELAPFAVPVAGGILLHLWINYAKFGVASLAGGYEEISKFDNSLLTGLYGFLLSPGESIFLFTPLLLTAPWSLRYLYRRHPSETIFLVLLAVSYLGFYAKLPFWHGMYCFGPRYLVPIMALLLLPLAGWMQHAGPKAWIAATPLAAVGFWIQLIHVAVNFSYVDYYEHYFDYQPPYSFLFIPDVSPVAAHSRALLAGDYRVDMWLVTVYRSFGFPRTFLLTVILLALAGCCVWKLRRSLRAMEAAGIPGSEIQFGFPRSYRLSSVALLIVMTGGLKFLDLRFQSAPPAPPVTAETTGKTVEAATKQAEQLVRVTPSPQNYLSLSLRYYDAGRFLESIGASNQALKMKPDYAEAYNNICAAHIRLGNYQEAAAACEQALKLKSNLDIARNNLAYVRQRLSGN